MSRDTKRTTEYAGIPIGIEIDEGDVKSGIDDLGEKWSHQYEFPYGEIPGTMGADGDPVDVYLGVLSEASAPDVFVVHQLRRDGSYDEDKCFLGFEKAADAEQAYRDHGPDFGFGYLDAMSLEDFKTQYLNDNSALGRGKVPL
jgi:hypothetical protein